MLDHHPGLAVKYLLPQYTRGTGVEVGPGIGRDSEPLYPHFGKLAEEGGPWPTGLDFILVCNVQGDVWFEPTDFAPMVRMGGFLLHANGSRLIVSQRTEDGWQPVDLAIRGPSVGVVRYGGFGDMIQASTIFPALKAQGLKVYVLTTPQGKAIIEHDPHVDGFLLQDTDQVPNEELAAFWEVQAARFSRFVNLSESVEGTLLAYPGRANHAWPHAVRKARMSTVNYLEWTAQLAEVPFMPAARFYPTHAENEAVDRFLQRERVRAITSSANAAGALLGPVNAPVRFNVMVTLSGSSVHKAYPHMDHVIDRVLANLPLASVLLVGDLPCQILEVGWERHPRVMCLSGRIGIRETLALALACDCVIGPETGVLNAVGLEPMAKVVILSHSSATNLTKHWANTTPIEPPTDCYPCNRLHHDRRYCPEHQPTGAALCAFDVEPTLVYLPIHRAYEEWGQLRQLIAPRLEDQTT